jgi:hypothetical protein
MRHNWLILNKIQNAGRYVLFFNNFSLFFHLASVNHLFGQVAAFTTMLKYRQPHLVAKQSA